MKMDSNYDVLVVGAGAAGLTAAIGLVKAGFAVAVVEDVRRQFVLCWMRGDDVAPGGRGREGKGDEKKREEPFHSAILAKTAASAEAAVGGNVSVRAVRADGRWASMAPARPG